MATIRKRGGKWQCIVRRDGRTASKSFAKRTDAVKWGVATEARADAVGGKLTSRAKKHSDALRAMTLADALHQLADQMTGGRWRLHSLARAKMAKLRIDALTTADVLKWRDGRLRDAKPSTVVREMSLLQTAVAQSLSDGTENVLRQVRRPRVDDRRERRLNANATWSFRLAVPPLPPAGDIRLAI